MGKIAGLGVTKFTWGDKSKIIGDKLRKIGDKSKIIVDKQEKIGDKILSPAFPKDFG